MGTRVKDVSTLIHEMAGSSGEIDDVLSDNPGLKPRIAEAMARGYRKARIEAAKEAGLETNEFPETCPYSFDDAVSRKFER